MAILKIENKIDGLTSIPISIHSKIGDKIYSAGFPLISEMGESLKVTEGIISSTSFLNDHTKYQISCPITKGNSGGALVNEHGSLVGVTQGGYRPDLDTENVNAAVKSLYIMSLSQAESECKINIVNSEGGNIDFDVIKNRVFPIFIY